MTEESKILRVWRERGKWRGIRLQDHKVCTHLNIHSADI